MAFVTSVGNAGDRHIPTILHLAREGIRKTIPDLFSSFWDAFSTSHCFVVLSKPSLSGSNSQWIWLPLVFCYETQLFGSEIWRCGSDEQQNVTVF